PLVRSALSLHDALPIYEHAAIEDIAGGSPAMKRVIEVISKVAPTDSTVLLLGESGTGKELLADTIHRLSPRRDMPFIAINCAARSEEHTSELQSRENLV